MEELRDEPQHQTDLVDDTSPLDIGGHRSRNRPVDRQRLLAEHRETVFGGGGDESVVFRRPGGDEDRVDPIEDFVLGDRLRPDAIGERLGAVVGRVVYGDDAVIDRRVFQEPTVRAADEIPCPGSRP